MTMPLWFSNLLFWSAQIILLVLVAGFLPRLFQIRQPRVLLLYWRALLAISLLLPFFQPWHRLQNIGAISIAPDLGRVSFVPESSPTVVHWHFPGIQIIAQMIGVVILAGIAARFVMLALGLLKLRQFRQASSPIPSMAEAATVLEKTRAQVCVCAEFRFSANVDSPVTFGFTAPVILLPERFSSMDARFQAAIACHELLHVRRRDWAHHLFEEILRAVFWFHPAIAWLIARVRLAREQVVDLEVVRLTNARKPYLQALLGFTTSRARAAAIPAPPFLVERQLGERVALMLKEVRMSRTRLMVSLTAISCSIALAIIFAVSIFPLKAAPRLPQNPPQKGAAQGVSGGVTGGISGGVTGGVSGGGASTLPANGVAGGISGGVSGGTSVVVGGSASRDIPTVDNNTIWTDTVKRGPMVRQVRGLGKLIGPESSKNLVARISLPEFMAKEVQPHQNATVAFAVVLPSMPKRGVVKGHVSSISSEVTNGMVSLDVSLDGPLSQAVAIDLPVDATIDIETIENVLNVGRPVHAGEGATGNSTFSVFKIINGGTEAVRVNVNLGRASVNTIEVLDGLKEGDKIILSDMSSYDNADRIHIK